MFLATSADIQVRLAILFFWDRLPIGLLLDLLRGGCCVFLAYLGFSLFDKGSKFDRSVVGNFDVGRGASNPHGGDRGVNLHVASLCNLPSNKGERSFGETDQ